MSAEGSKGKKEPPLWNPTP